MAKRKGGKRGAKAKGRKGRASKRAPSSHRKQWGEGLFTRVQSAPSSYPKGLAPDWRGWARSRQVDALGPVPMIEAEDVDAIAQQSILDELLRGHIDPEDAISVAEMDPDGSYVMVMIVRGGSGREQARERGYHLAGDERRIVYVGRGRRLWWLAMYHAHEDGEVVSVEVKRAKRDWKVGKAFPVWSDGEVELEGGGVIRGSGDRALFEAVRRDQKKTGGARKKGGGGMTAEERARNKTRKREKGRRFDRSEEKIAALMKTDPAAARKMRVRVDAQRVAAIGRMKRAKVFKRAKPKKSKSKTRKGARRGKRGR